jgi:hypothetical protein
VIAISLQEIVVMKFKYLILLSAIFHSAFLAKKFTTRFFPDENRKSSADHKTESNNFVLIPNHEGDKTPKSKDVIEDKTLRSSPYLSLLPMPMTIVNSKKASADYFSYPSNHYDHHHNHHGSPNNENSLISANVNLLEPFLLISFLLFVLSLLEKARIIHPIARLDRDYYYFQRQQQQPLEFERFIDYNNYVKRNQSEYNRSI